ncbi:DoxX family protein [Chishuiella changwenlii]|uniref:DoxX family protein n=1 Tax=Chishuiella changwenlii TaxID=1434701 RepID=UPI002FDA916D
MKIKLRKIIYWTLTIIVALIFIGSAMGKLISGEQSQQMAKMLGGEKNLIILGVIEIFIALLWIIPRTGVIGTILGASYLGGAIAVHFINNESIIAPLVIQIILWVSAFYRYPEFWQRLIYNIKTTDIN